MLRWFYARLMEFLGPLLKVYLLKRRMRGKEDPRRFGEREGVASRPRPEGKLIWCHAASVGESISLLPLVQHFVKIYPDVHVLVTTGTVASADLIAKRLPARAFHQFMPVDRPSWVGRFLDHWKPDMVIWTESELWPAILEQIHIRKIPAALVNARMSEGSFRKWQIAPGLIREVLEAFDACLTQNPVEAERLEKLGARNVATAGNLKYAADMLPCNEGKLAELKKAVGERPAWLAVSTHQGEEQMMVEAHMRLKAKFPRLLTIIIPRHAQRGTEVVQMCRLKTVKISRRSSGVVPAADDDIYIADTMGELGVFFSAVPICCVGGSFVPVGGHNPIEPAHFGCAILYGPHMQNFKSVQADFEAAHAAISCKNLDDLCANLETFLASPETVATFGKSAREVAVSKRNVIDEIMRLLTPVLEHAGFSGGAGNSDLSKRSA